MRLFVFLYQAVVNNFDVGRLNQVMMPVQIPVVVARAIFVDYVDQIDWLLDGGQHGMITHCYQGGMYRREPGEIP